jgi:hypothetical protein
MIKKSLKNCYFISLISNIYEQMASYSSHSLLMDINYDQSYHNYVILALLPLVDRYMTVLKIDTLQEMDENVDIVTDQKEVINLYMNEINQPENVKDEDHHLRGPTAQSLAKIKIRRFFEKKQVPKLKSEMVHKEDE